MKWNYICLLLLFNLYFLAVVPSALSEPMPKDVPVKLEQILERQEFHARKAYQSPLEEMWMDLVNDVRTKLKEFFSRFKLNQGDMAEDSAFTRFITWLAEIIESVIDVIEVVAKFVFVILVLYLGYRIYKTVRENWPLFSFSSAKETKKSTEGAFPSEPIRSVEELLRSGELFAALFALRKNLRHENLKKYSLPYSSTDRELKKSLGDSAGIFAKVAEMFEMYVFAGKDLDSQDVRAVCEQYIKRRGVSG